MSVPIRLETLLFFVEVALFYHASTSACKFLLAIDIDVITQILTFPESGQRRLMFDSSEMRNSMSLSKFTPSSQKERDIEAASILNSASIEILRDAFFLYYDLVASRKFLSSSSTVLVEEMFSLEQRYQGLVIDDLDERNLMNKRREHYFQKSHDAETGGAFPTTANLFALVDEYRQLSGLPDLSDENADRIALILELAQLDPELHQYLKEVDDQIYSQVEKWL